MVELDYDLPLDIDEWEKVYKKQITREELEEVQKRPEKIKEALLELEHFLDFDILEAVLQDEISIAIAKELQNQRNLGIVLPKFEEEDGDFYALGRRLPGSYGSRQ